MTRHERVAVAGLVLAPGLFALVFVGPQFAACLGPLGVTGVECAASSGIFPTTGPGLPAFMLAAGLAALVLAPIPSGGRWAGLAGALLGGIAGTLAYSRLAPRTMEGVTSTGAWLSLARPLDGNAHLAAAIGGAALAGFVLGHVVARLPARHAGAARTTDGTSRAG